MTQNDLKSVTQRGDHFIIKTEATLCINWTGETAADDSLIKAVGVEVI